MKITEHFSLDEFKQPARHGLNEVAYPTEWMDRLTNLCIQLEQLRAVFNRPVKVISGYRTMEYNSAIGGAKDSQHMKGRAADIVIDGVSASEVNEAALKLIKEGKLMIKGLGYYPNSTPPFNHLDQRSSDNLVLWVG